MTDTKNGTPLWLDLRKEYIDDNFEKLLQYLHENYAIFQHDSFYTTTINLLRARIEELTTTLANHPIYEEEDGDKEEHSFNIRLLGAYLLVDAQHELSLKAFIAMMMELSTVVPAKESDKIVHAISLRMRQNAISDFGYTWDDIMELKPEILLFKILQKVSMQTPLCAPLTYSRYGTAILNKDGLMLAAEERNEAKKLLKQGVKTLQTDIDVSLLTYSSCKMKQSKENDVVALDEYTKNFVLDQYKVQPKTAQHVLKLYGKEDEVVVRISHVNGLGELCCETVDPSYERIVGKIEFTRPNIIYYAQRDFLGWLKAGDRILVTVEDPLRGIFSLEKTFIRYVVESCREDDGYNSVVAKVICKVGRALVWMNEFGTPFYTHENEQYNIGSVALLQISEYGSGSFYGKINADIINPLDKDDDFNTIDAQRDCVRQFVDDTILPTAVQMIEEDKDELDKTLLQLLVRILYNHQKTLLKPSERYCYLANARVIAEMIGDEVTASFLRFNSTYLRVLVQFVNRQDIRHLTLETEDSFAGATSTLTRLAVLDLLKEYGKKEDSDKLSQAIHDFKEKIPMIASLARLIQTANSMQGTLSNATINVIRREIIKTLSLETENDADLEAEGGEYLGIESGTQEFKTSMIYPSNNGMQPAETKQNTNVMKGICAFLNSTTGGTLYLGVSDQGYVKGLDEDMKYLHYNDIDHYIRYVQDKALYYFGKDSMMYLNRIEPMFDGRVVAIHVEPHPYRVVELNGTAYLRVNAESREMPESTRQALIAKKVFKDKDKAAAISLLQHAHTQRLCVVLHQYASSNSGSVTDRFVEAYDVLPDDDLVICFDRDKRQVRVFNINRIGYVEVKEKEPWLHEKEHKKMEVDAFHMTGEKKYQISLQLDLLARNQLIEEFPRSKVDITQQKGDANTWFYNTHVFSLVGIGRFYVGLANHIKILQAPELVEYIKEYKDKWL